MDSAFGVEANPIVSEVEEFEALLHADTNVLEQLGAMFIYTNESDAACAKGLLQEADLFEEIHPMIVFENGVEGECFFDYGFKGENRTYLLKESLTGFSLVGDNQQMIEMAKLQIEEHLVYQATIDYHELFFVEHQLSDLIKRIAEAYKCGALFLDLDKWKKKL